MESDDEDRNTSLRLGLGFQSVDLLIHSNKPERKRKSYDLQGAGGSSPLLSLSLSESNRLSPPDDDRVRDSGDQTTSDDLEKLRTGVATAPAPAPAPAEAAPMSTLTAISSFSHASRLSDEDEDCSTPRKKLRLSRDQISILEDSFKVHSTLNPNQKQDLAAQLNLRPRQVEVWFQNRRARIKMKQTELDCESLKKCCETLKEENRRLHKEVMELKSIKQTVPFLMQLPTGLPVPALTMCPSCEKISRSTIPDGDGSSTTSLFSSTSSNNAPKTRLCKSVH